jgi:hypothetical protein
MLTQDVVTKHNDSLEYLAASPGVKAKRVMMRFADHEVRHVRLWRRRRSDATVGT